MQQTEHFAHYNGKGDATYYRVLISGLGKNGKVQYRSGWFDANAVDNLFGVVGDENRLKVITAERQRAAVERTFSRYMEALENEDAAEKISARKQHYEEALRSISGNSSLGESPISALNRANQKFVIILASDPDAIIQNLRNRAKSSKISDSIGLILTGQSAQADQAGQLRLQLVTARLEGLKASLTATREGIAENSTDAGLKLAIREILAEVEALR
jgi:hypothetical protein